jgi:hypothetical protein
VLAIDLLGTGDTAEAPDSARREVEDPIFYAFNPSLLSMRIQDVLTALAALRQYDGARKIELVGIGEGARVALLALPMAGEISGAAMDLAGIRRTEAAWLEQAYHPLVLKVGGMKTALALTAGTPLLLNRADRELTGWAEAVYKAAGKAPALRVRKVGGTKLGEAFLS